MTPGGTVAPADSVRFEPAQAPSRGEILSLIWELPLALLSLVFFTVAKWLVSILYNAYMARLAKQAPAWRPFSRETLTKPLALPMVMVRAPRWNTHAFIATLGPVAVEEWIEIDTAAASNCAHPWNIVFYAYPGGRTLESLDSVDVAAPGRTRIALGPGRYALGLRYYGWGDEVMLPGVEADGRTRVPPQRLAGGLNAFYEDLNRQRSFFYFALHYYVYLMLRWQRVLPLGFVRRHYLPVGNPDTFFRYGCLRKGERLRIQCGPELLRDYLVFYNLYDRASFPHARAVVEEPEVCSEPSSAKGFYLVRLCRKRADAVAPDQARLRVLITGGGGD